MDRLKPNKIADGLEELKDLKEYLFKLRLKYSSKVISEDWKMADLENVLKSLKNGKARDPHGHIYEIFKYAGKDLKHCLLKFLNSVKKKQKYPEILQPSNISSFYKKKGDRSDLDNDRGVFNVVKMRSILDKMIYNDKYDTIEQSMSGSNIGARKGKNIRDHLFVINAVINDVTKNKKDVDIEIMDIAKCFDKMWYAETGNDIFNAGVRDDKFVILANSNAKCQVAVKTPWGTTTERVVLENIEMQGTVPAPLKASVQLDTLGKECYENSEGLFKYKECVNITPLIMIDDILAISDCGNNSVKTNAIIQSKIETKQLRFGPKKCFKMHIGNKALKTCPTLKVHEHVMESVEKEKYLGDILSSSGKINDNILERQSKGNGYVNQILSMLKEVSFGFHYIEMAMLFRSSILVNGMLCSSEALYGITINHVEQLESCDKMLFSAIFKSPSTTPTVAYYLETGAIQVKYLLKGRRIMFLWSILQQAESELVRKVYEAQKMFPVKDDWIFQVKNDMEELDIEFDEKAIKNMKKWKFKKIVYEKMNEVSHSHLLSLKKGKLANLSSHYGMKEYLKTDRMNLVQKQLLFSLRTRMVMVKCNYRNKYGDNLSCSLCQTLSQESQEHLLVCPGILEEEERCKEVQYLDIFGTLDEQVRAAHYWTKIMQIRTIKLKENEISLLRSQAH